MKIKTPKCLFRTLVLFFVVHLKPNFLLLVRAPIAFPGRCIDVLHKTYWIVPSCLLVTVLLSILAIIFVIILTIILTVILATIKKYSCKCS